MYSVIINNIEKLYCILEFVNTVNLTLYDQEIMFTKTVKRYED